MSELRPFRQYDEHDVINLFTMSTSTVDAGRMVKINTGWKADADQVDLSSAIGNTYGNVLSTTWALTAKVQLSAGGDHPIGMTLVAMKEDDENGEKLVYNPRKAAEMGVVVPGQSVPLLTRGLVIVKSTDSDWTGTAFAAGDTIYAAANGELSPNHNSNANKAVGIALGAKDANNFALVKIDLLGR